MHINHKKRRSCSVVGNVPLASKRLGLTQQQAADVAKLTQPYWAAIESGSRNPTWYMLNRICEAVGLELRRAIVSKRI